MKERELREHAECSCCKKKIGHTGIPMFWTVDTKRHLLYVKALRRQGGLTELLGGSAKLAMIMGADEEMTTEVLSKSLTLCEECALPIMTLLEACGEW